jgi:hypothetical protein
MPKKKYLSKPKNLGTRNVRKVPKGLRNPSWWSRG